MSTKATGASGPGSRPNRRPTQRPGGKTSRPGAPSSRARRTPPRSDFKILDKSKDKSKADASVAIVEEQVAPPPGPFRVLIAIHRPRFRGRAVRASDLVGWDVTTLLNKQDVVGPVSKLPRPPDLVLLSGDFGRQRDYAIFRAIQSWRKKGMKLIGMVEDCATAPEGFPDSAPEKLCDVCLSPPYTAAGIRALLVRLYEEKRGEPAPPPKSASMPDADLGDEPEED